MFLIFFRVEIFDLNILPEALLYQDDAVSSLLTLTNGYEGEL